MKSCTENSKPTVASSNPQTIGGVEREETPLEEYIRARDYYIDRLEAHLAGKPVRDMCEAQLWFKSAESAWRKSIEHQLSVIGEMQTTLKAIAEFPLTKEFDYDKNGEIEHLSNTYGVGYAADHIQRLARKALSYPIIGDKS